MNYSVSKYLFASECTNVHSAICKHCSNVCKLLLCLSTESTNSARMRTIVTAELQRQYSQTELTFWIRYVGSLFYRITGRWFTNTKVDIVFPLFQVMDQKKTKIFRTVPFVFFTFRLQCIPYYSELFVSSERHNYEIRFILYVERKRIKINWSRI